jgi:c-di-GMP-binding flagellar brake protein YcgR
VRAVENGSKQMPSLERRRYSRLRDNVFIFGNVMTNSGDEFKAFTQNISVGGLMFETERDISQESELELEIYQPMESDKRVIFSIFVRAKVIWAEKRGKGNFEQGENRYRIGIEFSEIKDEDRQIVIKYVARRLLKR